MSAVIVGEKIPLALNLHDNRPDLKVQAEIFSMFGDRLATVYLYHAQSGLYINTDLPMPNVPYIIVKYDVLDSEDYESVAERFDSSQREPDPEKFVSGQVDTVVKSKEFITGVVDEITNK